LIFAALLAVTLLNAKARHIIVAVTDYGWDGALLGLFGINAINWLGLAAAAALVVQDRDAAALTSADQAVLAACLACALLPSPNLAALAALGGAGWMLATSPQGSIGRRAAIILAAIAAQQLMSRTIIAGASFELVWFDTWLVGLFTSVPVDGNVLLRPTNGQLIVGMGCSSFHNVSLGLLCWCILVAYFDLRLDRKLCGWAALSVLVMMLINTARMLSLLRYPEHFEWLHAGTGAAIFAWSSLVTLLAIGMWAVADAVQRQGQLGRNAA
jgi:hypothetical protein